MVRRTALAVALGAMLLPRPAAAIPESPFQALEVHFRAHPELRGVPGSGWNPYQRLRWFHEQRMDQGRPPAPGARWNAWTIRRARAAATRSSTGGTWFSLGPTNMAGRMLAIDFHPTNPSIVYAGGADGGVWRSTNSGTTWTPLSDELPSLAVGAIAVSKTDPSVIVIGTGEPTLNVDRVGGVGILRSTDAGATWVTTSLSNGPGGADGFHFALCTPGGVFLAGSEDGLWRSTDDGATWTEVKTGNGWYHGVVSPLDGTRIFVVRGNAAPGASVKVSTDEGATWAKVGTGQPTSLVFGKSRLGISGQTLYCYIGGSGTAGPVWGLIKSTDDGATWTQPAAAGLPNGQSWYNLACAADPNNPDRVICGAVTLGRSGDGGATFNDVGVGTGVHPDHHALAYEPGSSIRVWGTNDGGVWFSPTDGQNGTWASRNSGLVTFQFYDIGVNSDPGTAYYALGGTQDNGTDKWAGTTTWTQEIGGDGFVCNICPMDGSIAYGELFFGDHRKSTNGDAPNPTFLSFNTGLTGTGEWVTPVALDPNDCQHLLTETNTGIFRSTNGTSWSQVASHSATWIDISRLDGQVAWSIGGTTAHVTTDNGDTWTARPTIGNSGTKILAHPVELNTAWATFSGYDVSPKVARTTDSGVTWTDRTGDLPVMPVNAIAIDPGLPSDIYIGTDVGVWHTTNEGVNWLPLGDGSLPNAVVADLEIANPHRKLVAGTHGRGAWEMDLPTTGTAVPGGLSIAPKDLLLDPPRPNPASQRTLLRFAARSEYRVTLRIHDVNGRLVRELAELPRGDGVVRTAPWHTSGVPSGVYFAVLRAGNVERSRKITVLR